MDGLKRGEIAAWLHDEAVALQVPGLEWRDISAAMVVIVDQQGLFHVPCASLGDPEMVRCVRVYYGCFRSTLPLIECE